MRKPQVTSGREGRTEIVARLEWYCDGGELQMAEFVSRDYVSVSQFRPDPLAFSTAVGFFYLGEDASEDARDRNPAPFESSTGIENDGHSSTWIARVRDTLSLFVKHLSP